METISFVRDHFNMTILLIEHDMNLVMGICEGICVLNFGQIIAKLHEHDCFFARRKAFQNCHQIVSGIEIGGFDVLIVLRQPIDAFRLRWATFFFQKFPSIPPGRTHINHGMIFLCL